MPFRFAAALAAMLMLAGAAQAKGPGSRAVADALPQGKSSNEPGGREPSGGLPAGRERQKKCIAEWRAMSASERTSAGPKWPAFYSKCVKRQKVDRS